MPEETGGQRRAQETEDTQVRGNERYGSEDEPDGILIRIPLRNSCLTLLCRTFRTMLTGKTDVCHIRSSAEFVLIIAKLWV